MPRDPVNDTSSMPNKVNSLTLENPKKSSSSSSPFELLQSSQIKNPKNFLCKNMRKTMFQIPKLPLLLLLVISAVTADLDLVSELQSLRSRSPSGVIRLTDHTVSRFITSASTPRPYSLVVFFDAAKLHEKPELHLTDLRREFGLVSSSFISNNPAASDLFFCDIEFQDSQSSFAGFGVNSLPHIRLIGPGQSPKDSLQMEQGDFARLAESMSEFIESKTKLTVGPIHRPPMFSRNQIILAVVAFLIWTPFVVKKILTGKTLVHEPRVWLSGAVFVYFFSVSGAMHNIIRKMPMFLADRNDPTKLVFFYQGSGMQLGTEGFAIGFLYTVVGLLLAFLTRVLVKVRNVNAQRVVMLAALVVSFWAVKEVVYLDNWKTGYGIHAFWPSSWH